MQKHLLYYIIIGILICFPKNSHALRAIYNNKQFYNVKDKKVYIENHLLIDASTLHYELNKNGFPQSKIEVIYIISDINDSNKIYQLKKYELKGIPITQEGINADLVDVQRFNLDKGEYNIEIEIIDLNDSLNNAKLKDKVEITKIDTPIHISDISLIGNYHQTDSVSVYSKAGYEMIPFMGNYYPSSVNDFNAYFEIYTDSEKIKEPFILKRYFRDNKGKVLNQYGKINKITPSKSIYIDFITLNIENLPSGNYDFVIEVINTKNKIVKSKEIFIQRQNSEIVKNEKVDFAANNPWGIDTNKMLFYIKSLQPIAGKKDLDIIQNKIDDYNLDIKLSFFYNFWITNYGINAEKEWKRYLIDVYEAEKKYKTSRKHSFETARGEILLKYGKPNNIREHKNPAKGIPYEVWHYYKLEQTSDVTFVFYQPNQYGKEYQLLHSNLPGRLRYEDWKALLGDDF